WAPLASVSTETWKLIDAPRPELYQLVTDPKELVILYEREPAVARELAGRLREVRDAGGPAHGESRRPLDAATEEKLRSQGYVTVSTSPSEGSTGPDAKDMIATHVRIQRGRNLIRQCRVGDAIAECTRIVDAT